MPCRLLECMRSRSRSQANRPSAKACGKLAVYRNLGACVPSSWLVVDKPGAELEVTGQLL